MKNVNSRHTESYLKAKEETNALFALKHTNAAKLAEGFIGGGYIVTLTALTPKYFSIKLFVKANNKNHVKIKLMDFPDAYYFMKENPDYTLSICGAGLQHPSRAEGLFHEQKEN